MSTRSDLATASATAPRPGGDGIANGGVTASPSPGFAGERVGVRGAAPSAGRSTPHPRRSAATSPRKAGGEASQARRNLVRRLLVPTTMIKPLSKGMPYAITEFNRGRRSTAGPTARAGHGRHPPRNRRRLPRLGAARRGGVRHRHVQRLGQGEAPAHPREPRGLLVRRRARREDRRTSTAICLKTPVGRAVEDRPLRPRSDQLGRQRASSTTRTSTGARSTTRRRRGTSGSSTNCTSARSTTRSRTIRQAGARSTDIVRRFDHLKKLGVNCLQIMPVAEFAGDRSWGYNPAHIFAVESSYGGPKTFKEFVREAHRNGFAVILDVVYNHFGPSDLDLWRFDGWSENDGGGIYFYQDWRKRDAVGRHPPRLRPPRGPPVHPRQRPHVGRGLPHRRAAHGHDALHPQRPGRRRAEPAGRLEPDPVDQRRDPREAPEHDHHRRGPPAQRLDDQAGRARAGPGTAASGTTSSSTPSARRSSPPSDEQPVDGGGRARHHAPLQRRRLPARHLLREPRRGRQRQGPRRLTRSTRTTRPTGSRRSARRWPRHSSSPRRASRCSSRGRSFSKARWFRDTVPVDWDKRDEFRGIVRLYRDLIRLRLNRGGQTRGLTGQHVQLIRVDDREQRDRLPPLDGRRAGRRRGRRGELRPQPP